MTLLASEQAFAKVNLCLYLGPPREDGRHELVTLFDAVTLADDLQVHSAATDEVVCEGVTGPNLVREALDALRDAGWAAPPVRVTITKRIPVAAGMGGGSADAAALLRLAPRLAATHGTSRLRIAGRLGADVPSQLVPGPWIGIGAGHRLLPAPKLTSYGIVAVPQAFPLPTPDVYREADRLGLQRSAEELDVRRLALTRGFERGMVINDLQPAALSLAPAIGEALEAVQRVGADDAIVCGSGPTVIGLFWGEDGSTRAR
ncbi:MAG: 4-(cytidine 5'-diphospho)-2-C-methyl-D-erythritol kinase [Solirubrobacteraceae bacterium]